MLFWYIFPRFGMLRQETSGNPVRHFDPGSMLRSKSCSQLVSVKKWQVKKSCDFCFTYKLPKPNSMLFVFRKLFLIITFTPVLPKEKLKF
jgi:hypothetical protein